jgi:PelA/Pel-15E family pectate lyase
MYAEKRSEKYKTALDKAINFVLDSRLPAGGWPQRYPTEANYDILGKKNYASFITLNDDVCADNIEFLIMCYQIFEDEKLKSAAYSAMDFIKKLQTPPPYSGWADQYTYDLKPAAGRTYEPKGLNASTTMETIEILQRFYRLTADPKYLEGIPDAIEFLKSIKLSGSQLLKSGRKRSGSGETFTVSRYIDADTGTPQYIHREGSNIANGRYFINQDIENTAIHISSFANADINALQQNLEETKQIPPERLKATSPLLSDTNVPLPRYYSGGGNYARRNNGAEQIISSMTEDGAWLSPLRMTSHIFKLIKKQKPSRETRYASTQAGDGYDTSPYAVSDPNAGLCISTAEYIANMMTLIRYLDALK